MGTCRTQRAPGSHPGLLRLRLRKSRGTDGLVVLRTLFLTFLLALAMIGIVVAVLELGSPGFGSLPESPVVLGVLVVGALSSVGPTILRRPLQCEDDERLARSYVRRFFMQMAFAESGALAGFAGFLASSAGWMYLVGLAFSVAGFARLAPTADHLRRDQDELGERGCARSLLTALRRHSLRSG